MAVIRFKYPWMTTPILSKYATSLEVPIKERYIQKIETIGGVDPATLQDEELDPECLPPVEQSDLFSFLVLETSYYTNDQFKSYKSLEAYNQVVSGFVASVKGKIIKENHVVVAQVRHSQRMNDPLVDIWIITGKDGRIYSAHCLGCKAGLAESCSHVASVLFYIECWTRIHGKLACTQVKCTWLLPSYVNKVTYARVKDIDFTSARKLKEDLDCKIESLDNNGTISGDQNKTVSGQISNANAGIASAAEIEEVSEFYKKLNACNTKAAILSLNGPYADQFISKSRNVPVLTDLYDSVNLDLQYHELLRKCLEVKVDISEKEIDIVEKDTRAQAKGPGFFRHRAGRIGASVCGAVCHTNLAQPSQSLIQSICYPHLYKLNNKAIKHGCKYEESAIKAYEQHMKSQHVNFKIERCGLFIHKEYPYIHATPDCLVSCDCCGLGVVEIKCPISIKNGDFDEYVAKPSSCLEKVNGQFKLKRNHNHFFQVQQQLFTLSERKYCDFVVFSIDSCGNAIIVGDRIHADLEHSHTVIKKVEAFWRICILPEMLGRWYTRRCDLPKTVSTTKAICFCRGQLNNEVISCSNPECPYVQFHKACLALNDVQIPNKWYCPHCSKLPQFKKGTSRKKIQNKPLPSAVNSALLCDTICVCKAKPTTADRLVECHNATCNNGNFFHLSCLGLKRMPSNSKTTWLCYICRVKDKKSISTKATTSTSCTQTQSPVQSSLTDDEDEDSDNDIVITKVSTGSYNKYGILANLGSTDYDIINDPTGWLTSDIIQAAQVLIKEVNPIIEGLQRPNLGRVRNFDVVSGEFIQILHTGSDHWVCISSVGCVPGMVNLYDSLYHDAITQEIEDQTKDLLGGHLTSLSYLPVQQQNNGSDCGVFSIAFATCLALGSDPSHTTFDIPRMRPHLLACLKDGKISMFPTF